MSLVGQGSRKRKVCVLMEGSVLVENAFLLEVPCSWQDSMSGLATGELVQHWFWVVGYPWFLHLEFLEDSSTLVYQPFSLGSGFLSCVVLGDIYLT
jgi:hypothetical protein